MQQFQTQGYLILPDFNTREECDALVKRAEELATGFNYDGHPSIFQTSEQSRTSDDYFLNSGDKNSFFFVKGAFAALGNLNTDLLHLLHTLGHTFQVLDTVFNIFSLSQTLKQLVLALEFNACMLLQTLMN